MKSTFEKSVGDIKIHNSDNFKNYPPMFHKNVELLYVTKGSVDVCIDGKMKTLYPNEISVAFPYSVHSTKKSTDVDSILVMFSPDITSAFHYELANFKPEIPYISSAESLRPLFENIVTYAKTDERLTTCYLNVIIGEILQRINLVKSSHVDMNFAQQVLVYCADHYKEDINIKAVATALFLSESYVSKIFSQKLGYSFRDYINMMRIAEAKRLLKHSDTKITDVMYECGFKNQSSFNRIFFAETGMTPREYKEKKT
ncbi:MAG: helix-turn-helix transcriptional regulator [Clostridia bacterium]|nr:helix-turn-helix transcriptional regulator [Clostridia bacterium]